jgi:hypothetical protein
MEPVADKFEKIEQILETMPMTTWNEYVSKLGLYELINVNRNIWGTLVDHHKEFYYFGELYKQNQKKLNTLEIHFNVIPYGAGSSYIGAIQEYLYDGHVIPTAEQPKNLWDDKYGVMNTVKFTRPRTKRGITEVNTFKIEEELQQLMGRQTNWGTVFSLYHGFISSLLSTNSANFDDHHDTVVCEFTTHDHFALFNTMANARINTLVDVTWERFQWCWLLALSKHDRQSFANWKGSGGENLIWNAVTRCKQSWHLYQLTKHYQRPMFRLDYDSFFIEGKFDLIKRFSHYCNNRTTPTDEQVNYIKSELQTYHNRNVKLMDLVPMDLWNKVAEQ